MPSRLEVSQSIVSALPHHQTLTNSRLLQHTTQQSAQFNNLWYTMCTQAHQQNKVLPRPLPLYITHPDDNDISVCTNTKKTHGQPPRHTAQEMAATAGLSQYTPAAFSCTTAHTTEILSAAPAAVDSQPLPMSPCRQATTGYLQSRSLGPDTDALH
jgi:hypothetical protein